MNVGDMSNGILRNAHCFRQHRDPILESLAIANHHLFAREINVLNPQPCGFKYASLPDARMLG